MCNEVGLGGGFCLLFCRHRRWWKVCCSKDSKLFDLIVNIAEDYADPETDWREALGRVARCIHYLSGGQLLPPTLELLTLTLVIHDLLALIVH